MLKTILIDFLYKRIIKDASIWSLLAVNVVTIVVAITQQWDFGTVIWIYWTQSVIIGVYNFFRILNLKKFSTKDFKINGINPEATENTKKTTAGFFLMHYGFFHFIYMIFLSEYRIEDIEIFFTIVILFIINHSFSFVHNRKTDSAQTPNIGTIMGGPYLRIIPMHFTIIFFTLLPPIISLAGFMTIKLIVDLISHMVKHIPKHLETLMKT